ncbi:MAG: hypothetical protein M3619_19495 [Myxococcota bacterium]|nr:hypothetical protein [Myxococcota bacterium]
MNSSNALVVEVGSDLREVRAAAVLKGTARGLEAVVLGGASIDAIVSAIVTRIEEAPAFFRGSDIRIRVEDGPLAPGCLARLDDIAIRFELRIVEITAAKRARDLDADKHAVPVPNLAAGSAPSAVGDSTQFDDEVPTHSAAGALALPMLLDRPLPPSVPTTLPDAELTLLDSADELHSFEEPTQTGIPIQLAATAEIELETIANGPRLVIGPVRSGVILEHAGHVIVLGDVNPGAEVRAEGNIIVLGRLRGTAHAGIGQEVGFILALQLQPQQLRIGRQVARAADSDKPTSEAEIAYGSGDGIIVERYTGRLPRNLASSI